MSACVATATSKRDKANRHGKRAAGMTTITFPCSKALKSEIGKIAFKDSRPMASWLRLKLQEVVRRSRAGRKGCAP